MRFSRLALSGVCLAAAVAAFVATRPAPLVHAADTDAPRYAANGDLLPPTDYREWVYLSSGLGMNYTAKPGSMVMFDNVFVNPSAYRSFAATGTWPDKTMFALEVREAVNKGSINQQGHYQGTEIMGFEVHVKDEKRFPGGWAFFDFDSPAKNGTLIPSGAPCYACHKAHGAVDTTFVQFYPTLLPVAREKGTLTAEFLKASATPVSR